MRNIELEVMRIVRIDAGDVRTVIDGKATMGAKYEEIHFKVPYPPEDDRFQVGNVFGRYHLGVGGEETFKMIITDPELFDRFKVGQRVKLG